ncbi:MAG: STAS domain-containing protein [Chloroflexi bacterium]|nr:STAS domain-containing protein [Ardenticatenaceae bacterium]MBL1128174.1 STAS domain-containing protein [Chloroflexota bacterium]NOG34247.1 STAS domain-containing protein [Chloroflexota bacterium]GIK56361.1 MAG: sulfate transporter [Chloroflexota bacterium]
MATIKRNFSPKPIKQPTRFDTIGKKVDLKRAFRPAGRYLQRPYTILRTYDRQNLRPDLIAGITTAVIVAPQSIAFALIANLPPEMGLYAAMVGGIIGALWGSCNQLFTAPTNTISLLVFASLATVIEPGSQTFIYAAGLMAVMVGVLQFVLGIARLGMLVNFVSHSVIIGFATGAGILILVNQISPLLGISLPRDNILVTIYGIFLNLISINWATALIGLSAMGIILFIRRINTRLPTTLIAMIITSLLVAIFDLQEKGVATIGQLPVGLPPLADLPVLDLNLIGSLSAGALAVTAISLVQTTAIAHSVAAQTGQRLDSNQEFVGQGLANIGMGLFSGFAGSGSFSVSAINLANGAKTALAPVFAAGFILIALFTVGPLTAYLPRAAMAAALIVTAVTMIDRAEIRRILHSNLGEATILLATLLGTLFLDIQFAVLLGVLLSFILYILHTSTPRVHEVKPDANYKHFLYQPEKTGCPQLGIIEILGDLYFGAVHHVEDYILDHADSHPEQRFLLIRMHNVNDCDFSGIHMLENVVKAYRDRGGDVYLVRPQYRVKQIFATTDFVENLLGTDHILDKDDAITHIFYHVLDPAICIYECPVRVFKECANLPKRVSIAGIPHDHEVISADLHTIKPLTLWQQLHTSALINKYAVNGLGMTPPLVVDVREPREYRQGHIAEAQSIPLATILSKEVKLPTNQPIVLVCRSGRRSRRAAAALQNLGYQNIAILEGGMQAWEAEALLEAVGDSAIGNS